MSNAPPKQFLRFSLKIQLFSKKLSNKKIFSIKFVIKKAIFIFGVRCPLTGRTETQLDAPPSTLTSTFRNIVLLTHFLRQRFFLFWYLSQLFFLDQKLPSSGFCGHRLRRHFCHERQSKIFAKTIFVSRLGRN